MGGAGAAVSRPSYSNKAASYEDFQGYNNPDYQHQAANGWVGQQRFYFLQHLNPQQYNYPRIQYPTAGGPGNQQGYYYHHQYPASGGWVNQQNVSYQQQQNPQQYYYPRNHQ